jgi:hypothetical protein
MWEFNFPIQTTGTKESGVQDIHTICGCNDFDVSVGREPVELIQEFQHCSLNLTIPSLLRVETFGSFMNKDSSISD